MLVSTSIFHECNQPRLGESVHMHWDGSLSTGSTTYILVVKYIFLLLTPV